MFIDSFVLDGVYLDIRETGIRVPGELELPCSSKTRNWARYRHLEFNEFQYLMASFSSSNEYPELSFSLLVMLFNSLQYKANPLDHARSTSDHSPLNHRPYYLPT